jgi:hypothetical protein
MEKKLLPVVICQTQIILEELDLPLAKLES